MYRILVTDGMDKIAINKLKDYGYEVVEKHLSEDELMEEVKNFDALVIRSATKVNRNVIEAAAKGRRLKVVVRGGVGLDNVDVNFAKSKGIKVFNTPKASSISVAELTIGHMIAISRYINVSNITMRQGKWEKKLYKGVEIYGKTLGLIGFGRIAKEVAKRACALGMKVIYTDILGEAKGYQDYKFGSKEEVLKKANFISVHIPYNKNNPPAISKEEFDLMKNGVYIINCARGGVVDEEALLEGLKNGKVAGACIDVFKEEPALNKDLISHPRVSVSPHIGASTMEAQMRIGEEIVNIIESYFNSYSKNAI
ncbi:hydroxypyruvate reductase [Clostridium acetireducens DSM 10703]|uniref:Hydroxypyruvate reductase n=1 Tax=Clostridium acetireducens DSM 10703 TaxID=1121290 RepID=A0A1E8EWJ3_9CLOT|nr:D-2-hydroxyacid dehydrogenase [Clostridium acetireducens]OFI04992.1 hydroxypyruvate reductase [Clostridium acetireducens DSM 10703]